MPSTKTGLGSNCHNRNVKPKRIKTVSRFLHLAYEIYFSFFNKSFPIVACKFLLQNYVKTLSWVLTSICSSSILNAATSLNTNRLENKLTTRIKYFEKINHFLWCNIGNYPCPMWFNFVISYASFLKLILIRLPFNLLFYH